MNEQPQEYGMDYAMHNHDIGEICEMDNVLAVNKHLKEGRVLLSIKQDGDYPVYIMGVPRPKFCRTCGANGGRKVQLVWRHWDKQWVCKDCAHAWALDIERKRQQPQPDSE